MPDSIGKILLTLLDYWWAVLLLLLAGRVGYHFLTDRRQYRMINGELYIREGVSKWEKLKEHMKREHPETKYQGD